MRLSRLAAPVLASLLLLTAAACSDDDTPAACSAAQDFADSLRSLTDVNVVSEGTDALQSGIDDVQASWADLKDAASDQFGDDVDELDAAVSDAGDTVSSLPESGSLSEAATSIGDALSGISTSWDTLKGDIQGEFSDCDLSGG